MPEINNFIQEFFKVGNRMIFVLNCNKDISAGTDFYLHVRKPNGQVKTYDAVLNGTASVQGEVPPEDNDQAGIWLIEASVVLDAETYRFGPAEERVKGYFER